MSLKTHLQAWSDLFGRYKEIFAIAWQNRHENDKPSDKFARLKNLLNGIFHISIPP